jgi:hypothetical protein
MKNRNRRNRHPRFRSLKNYISELWELHLGRESGLEETMDVTENEEKRRGDQGNDKRETRGDERI